MEESLEKAAHKYAKNLELNHTSHMLGFINGGKWQQERSYSEDEVLKIIEHYKSYMETFIYQYIDKVDMEDIEEWFEQFKKK